MNDKTTGVQFVPQLLCNPLTVNFTKPMLQIQILPTKKQKDDQRNRHKII